MQQYVETDIHVLTSLSETEGSQISGFQRGSRVYNSVSGEILSMAGKKGLKRSSWFPHRVCSLIHRNITGPNNHKETWLLCFAQTPRLEFQILIPQQTPRFVYPTAKPVPSSSSPSHGSQTKAGHIGKLFRDYTLAPLISKRRRWRGLTQVPTGNGGQELPCLAPPPRSCFSHPVIPGISKKIFNHTASQTNTWGVTDHFHLC